MKLGYVGLGKMGYNMVELLLDKKYEVVVLQQERGTYSKDRAARSATGRISRARSYWPLFRRA